MRIWSSLLFLTNNKQQLHPLYVFGLIKQQRSAGVYTRRVRCMHAANPSHYTGASPQPSKRSSSACAACMQVGLAACTQTVHLVFGSEHLFTRVSLFEVGASHALVRPKAPKA